MGWVVLSFPVYEPDLSSISTTIVYRTIDRVNGRVWNVLTSNNLPLTFKSEIEANQWIKSSSFISCKAIPIDEFNILHNVILMTQYIIISSREDFSLFIYWGTMDDKNHQFILPTSPSGKPIIYDIMENAENKIKDFKFENYYDFKYRAITLEEFEIVKVMKS